MTRPNWVPDGIDLNRPSVARVYDYYLGGFHNFPVDRELAQAALASSPDVCGGARAGRAFLTRAVTHLAADLGVRQFLDLGSGIPTQGNVHDIVQSIDPQSRVVYVDIDPVAVAHSEAILDGNPCAVAVQGDLRRPDDVLGLPQVRDMLDPSLPVAVLLMLVLHFVPDADDPARVVRGYREALGTGSWLAISHATDEFHPQEESQRFARLYERTRMPITTRTAAQLKDILQGYDLLPPGIVLLEQWRPGEIADVPEPERYAAWAGIAQAS